MIRPALVTALFALPVLAAAACGGATSPDSGIDPDGSTSGGTSSGGTSSGGTSSGGTSSGGTSSGSTSGGASSGGASSGGASSGNVGRVPKNHRATAVACDGVRPSDPPNAPDAGSGPSVECQTHEECTDGTNGRCLGNGHDGWHCTYDLCKADADCGANSVCQCEGGFRSDNDVCLASGCHTDADCGASGFCSPSLGACGNFTKFVTYACHQPTDECVDDEDCAATDGGSCRFEPAVGHWKCSTSECAG